jgi:ribonuclease HII|tara:strand:+ start:3844 stop:4476 length:633 start_codon:yes stop_codon:yes gene_type:complete
MARTSARRTIENTIRRRGFSRVAGVDEVGRGCLAGPVVAAAVVLDPLQHIPGLRDSKLLTSTAREYLYMQIIGCALAWNVSKIMPREIDRINIREATFAAMRKSILALHPPPDFVLIDGSGIPSLAIAQRGLIKGDRRCAAIAAASIVAKVTRDRFMCLLHKQDSRYGFDRNKGYGTTAHIEAIRRLGYSSAHRRSFRLKALSDTILEGL